MSEDPEITDPRDPYRRPDIVTELDRWLAGGLGRFAETASVHVAVIQRARDEIVALRETVERQKLMLSKVYTEAREVALGALLQRLRRRDLGAEGQGMRASGYYWVLFNWPLFDPTRAPEWQPASWDDVTGTWVVIGSRQEVPPDEPCILAVDERRLERPVGGGDG